MEGVIFVETLPIGASGKGNKEFHTKTTGSNCK
jgi:hypothetical protein